MAAPCYEAISCKKDGSIALLSSSLTGQIWDGLIWVFSNYSELNDVAKETMSILGYAMPSGGSDVVWINDDTIATANDNGEIYLWSHGSLGHSLQRKSAMKGHDSMVLSLDKLSEMLHLAGNQILKLICEIFHGYCDSNEAISSLIHLPREERSDSSTLLLSGGADGNVITWDLTTNTRLGIFKSHTDMCWNVRFQVDNNNLFASTGQDACISLWDNRTGKLTNRIKNEMGMVSRAVAWHPLRRDTLAAGYEDGSVGFLDIRKLQKSETLSSLHPHSRPIHRMDFSIDSTSSDWLATVSNDNNVNIEKISSTLDKQEKLKYNSKDHSDFVHGLSWDTSEPNTAISCGWDGNIFRHNVSHLAVVTSSEPLSQMETS